MQGVRTPGFISAYSGRSSSWWLYRDAGKRGAGLILAELWTILWNRRADRPGPGSVSHNIWSVDKDNHGKYHWRDSFHYHISFLIVYRKVGP